QKAGQLAEGIVRHHHPSGRDEVFLPAVIASPSSSQKLRDQFAHRHRSREIAFSESVGDSRSKKITAIGASPDAPYITHFARYWERSFPMKALLPPVPA
ncbi:MAG: hypothetical protein BDTLLHRC_000058, partial [Candidatus Fervidibacter sp.]